MKITKATCRAYRLPLKERLVSSQFSMTHRELVRVDIETDDGITGTGWSTTAGVGAAAVHALIAGYLAPTLIGSDPRENERIWQRIWMECHAAGSGGTTALALAAIDIALWDIKGKAAGEPLWRLLGGARQSVEVYASAINLHLDDAALLAQVRGHHAAGYRSFKLKVGRAGLRADLDRCLAVREVIGDDGKMFLDANQKWNVGEAIQRCRILAEAAPVFIEEPILSDDVNGYAKVRAATGVPIAMGETLSSRFDFWNFVRGDAADFLQPDVWKVGGITEFLKIAALGASVNIPISPHGATEITAHLAAALPGALHVENIFGLNAFDYGATSEPMQIVDGRLTLGEAPGHGIVLDGPSFEGNEIVPGQAIERESLFRG